MEVLRSYYELDPNSPIACACCGWVGSRGQLVPTVAGATETIAFDCPNCSAMLIAAPIPTADHVRGAAGAADDRAIRDLTSAERRAGTARR